MAIELVFITHQRLEYTRLALASVLADPKEEFSLTIWDNASTDGTVEYLKNEVSDPRIADIVLSKENVGQTAAVNEVWSRSKADLLGKLDNDCIVTPGWTRALAEAHRDIERLGVVACWHFFSDDFDYERAKHKIQTFGAHQIFRHPWTCGTGLLFKRTDFEAFGPIREKATTQYWLRMAAAGRINGFYYPFIYQEHMDDPMSPYSKVRTETGLREQAAITAGLQARRFENVQSLLEWRSEIIRNLLDDPYDPNYYGGWRRKWAGARHRVTNLLRQTWSASRQRGNRG
jgi:glycosyltransferase involved in cell wall biosynthesis